MPKAKGSKPKGRIASGIHEVSPKRTRGKVYKPLGYGEGFGGAGAKSQHHPWLGMPRATPDIDRQRQRKRELGRQIGADSLQGLRLKAPPREMKLGPTGPMPLDWSKRRSLAPPGPDSPLAPSLSKEKLVDPLWIAPPLKQGPKIKKNRQK